MPEKKRTLTLAGQEIDVTEVDVVTKKESVAEYTLEDGATIRFSCVAMSVLRLDGQWDALGYPMYVVLPGQAVQTIDAPEKLKKG